MSSIKEVALALVSRGKSVIPVGRGKKPLVYWQDFQTKAPNKHQVSMWFDVNPEANLAMPTGKLNGVVVIDCDNEEANDFFVTTYPEAMSTCIAKTPRGYHYYFQYEEGIRNDAGRKVGRSIDVRGEGGYVLIPPSTIGPGHVYRWVNPVSPQPLPGALGDVLRGGSDIGPSERTGGDDGEVFGEGGRNNQLTRIGGGLRRHGADEESIIQSLLEINQRQCDPPLPEGEVITIAKSVCRYSPEDIPTRIERPESSVLTVPMSRIPKANVRWLWNHRIPVGRITIVEGDPGVCKSWLTLCIASAVTKGQQLPGHADEMEQGTVVIMSAEDALDDTVRPRLEQHNADLDKIHAVQGVVDKHGERAINLEDTDKIERVLQEHKPILMVIDPIVAFLGSKDMNNAGQVRSLLAPLAKLAEKHQVAIVLVRHLNKSTDTKTSYRGQGSIDFLGAVRSAFQVLQDPGDRHRRFVCHVKSNLAPTTPTLIFSMENSRVEWVGESWQTAEEIVKLKKTSDANNNHTDDKDPESGSREEDTFG